MYTRNEKKIVRLFCIRNRPDRNDSLVLEFGVDHSTRHQSPCRSRESVWNDYCNRNSEYFATHIEMRLYRSTTTSIQVKHVRVIRRVTIRQKGFPSFSHTQMLIRRKLHRYCYFLFLLLQRQTAALCTQFTKVRFDNIQNREKAKLSSPSMQPARRFARRL